VSADGDQTGEFGAGYRSTPSGLRVDDAGSDRGLAWRPSFRAGPRSARTLSPAQRGPGEDGLHVVGWPLDEDPDATIELMLRRRGGTASCREMRRLFVEQAGAAADPGNCAPGSAPGR
jgi:hypothetical protein